MSDISLDIHSLGGTWTVNAGPQWSWFDVKLAVAQLMQVPCACQRLVLGGVVVADSAIVSISCMELPELSSNAATVMLVITSPRLVEDLVRQLLSTETAVPCESRQPEVGEVVLWGGSGWRGLEFYHGEAAHVDAVRPYQGEFAVELEFELLLRRCEGDELVDWTTPDGFYFGATPDQKSVSLFHLGLLGSAVPASVLEIVCDELKHVTEGVQRAGTNHDEEDRLLPLSLAEIRRAAARTLGQCTANYNSSVVDALITSLLSDGDDDVRRAAAQALVDITMKSTEDLSSEIRSRLRRTADAMETETPEAELLLSQLAEIAEVRELSTRATRERGQEYGGHLQNLEQRDILTNLCQEKEKSDARIRNHHSRREAWQRTRSGLTLQQVEVLDKELARFGDLDSIDEPNAQRVRDLVSQGGSFWIADRKAYQSYSVWEGLGNFIVETFIPHPDRQHAPVDWQILSDIGLTSSWWVTSSQGCCTQRSTVLEAVFAALAYGRHSWGGASGEGDEHIYHLLELAFVVEGLSPAFCHAAEEFVARYQIVSDRKTYHPLHAGDVARRALQFCFWKHPASLSVFWIMKSVSIEEWVIT